MSTDRKPFDWSSPFGVILIVITCLALFGSGIVLPLVMLEQAEARGIAALNARLAATLGREFTMNGHRYIGIGQGTWGGVECISQSGPPLTISLLALEAMVAAEKPVEVKP